jgi:RimJ/RimL family protein N-acetyltransferase
MSLSKRTLVEALPLAAGDLAIREWTRDDMDVLSQWPDYVFPHHGFEFSFRALSSSERDRLYQARQEAPDLIVLVIDHAEATAIGYISLSRIDWSQNRFGNLGLRIHPHWVNKGIGSTSLRVVVDWAFNCGIKAIGVDVAASNVAAVRCHKKVGFRQMGEFWRDAPDVAEVDIGASRYGFLRPHLRLDDEVPKLRFLLMELRR